MCTRTMIVVIRTITVTTVPDEGRRRQKSSKTASGFLFSDNYNISLEKRREANTRRIH